MKTKKGPRGRNFTPDERALALRIIMSGGTLDEVNSQLSAHQSAEGLTERAMPESSFNMVKNTYSRFLQNDDAVRDHIFHPSPMGKLRAKAKMIQE
jgi:hypothetical protein